MTSPTGGENSSRTSHGTSYFSLPREKTFSSMPRLYLMRNIESDADLWCHVCSVVSGWDRSSRRWRWGLTKGGGGATVVQLPPLPPLSPAPSIGDKSRPCSGAGRRCDLALGRSDTARHVARTRRPDTSRLTRTLQCSTHDTTREGYRLVRFGPSITIGDHRKTSLIFQPVP